MAGDDVDVSAAVFAGGSHRTSSGAEGYVAVGDWV